MGRTSCRNAKAGDLVTEPAIRELYRSGLFTVQPSCGDADGGAIEYVCLDCGQRFEPRHFSARLSRDALGREVEGPTLEEHAYDLPRHRVVARCSCGALEVR